MDKLSYALGISMGNNFMRSGIEKLDYSDFAAGVKAAYESDYSQMTTDTAKRVVNEFFAMMEERIKDVNKKAGDYSSQIKMLEEQYTLECYCKLCNNLQV